MVQFQYSNVCLSLEIPNLDFLTGVQHFTYVLAMFGFPVRQLELDFFSEKGLPHGDSSLSERVLPQKQDSILKFHEKRISGLLSVLLPHSVDVLFTNNRSTMISYRIKLGRLELRIHRMFRLAEDHIIGSLAAFILDKSSDEAKLLDKFIAENRHEIVQKKQGRKRYPVASEGQFHDLSETLERVKKSYFGGGGEVSIGWSRGRKARGRRRSKSGIRSRALATYSFEDRTIRVNPVLDSPKVPEYVLDWVVYHEMLHHVLPIEERGGRRQFHTGRFKTLERAFEKYDQAKNWEKSNLDWLLR